MAQSLEEFLTLIHLNQYVSNFIINKVNILAADDETLQQIGIHMIGHRKRILTELNILKSQINKDDFDSGINTELDDEPPPLPPKQIKPAGARLLTLDGDHVTHEDSIPTNEAKASLHIPKEKPVKPPRSSIKSSMSLPVGVQGLNDYKMLQYPVKLLSPVIPPREDLEEPKHKETCKPSELQLSDLVPSRPAPLPPSAFLTSPTTTTSPTKSLLEITSQPTKPAPPIRPGRNSVKMTTMKSDFVTMLEAKFEKDVIAAPQEQLMTKLDYHHAVQSEISNSTLVNVLPVSSTPDHRVSDDERCEDDNKVGEDLVCFKEDDDESEDEKVKDTFTLSMFKDKERFLSIVEKNNKQEEKKKDNRKSRYLQPGKSGFLSKRGGQKGDKSVQKRWIEFDGYQLSYFKEKNGIPKQIIPVSRMNDVEIEPTAKKPTFHLITPNRRFTFIEPNGKQDEMTIWVSILMEAILNKNPEDNSKIGGRMADPNKEGWLLKQGHNLLQDFKQRYVAIKDDKLCYYHSFEDFKEDLPINCLDMALVSLKEDADKQRLFINTSREKTFVFETEDAKSHCSWKAAIERSIQIGLGSCQFLSEIQMNPANTKCGDCGEKDPIYASVNLLVVVCAECIGCHRFLGTSVSKTKSILMDVKVWTPSLVKLFQTIGNDASHSLWCSKLPSDDQIKPDIDREHRQTFITDKYKNKRYFQWSEMYGYPEDLGLALRKNVTTDNVLETLRLIVSGADVYFVPEDSEDRRTPYELAADAGMDLQVELLTQYNAHLTVEERQSVADDGIVSISPEALAKELDSLPKLPDTSNLNEKCGVLLMRSTRNESWKEKMFSIEGRKLKFIKGMKPDELEILDLTQLEEMEYGKEDSLTIMLKIAGRVYFLKGFTQEDADSWYSTIRNKQVIGVPIECQECNEKGIPYLIEKCVGFVERNGLLTIGIYRLSGSQLKLKKLILQFNQDPRNIRLSIDDFPDIHEVAGLLKQYLRELPEPLITTKLYESFIANSYETQDTDEHTNKLYRYKELLSALPQINYQTLRCLVLHLIQVIKVHDRNKMELKNIIMLFGPILLSNANTTEQSWLNAEYAVLKDLLDYYKWLFDVSDSEIKAADAMIDVLIKQESLESKPQQSAVIDSMQIPIMIQHTEDQMKMTNRTMPSDVCLFGIQKYNLSVDGNWALFEVTKDHVYERPVHAKEPVLQLAINSGSANDLVVKYNHVAERISPFQSSITATGNLHFAKEEGKWQKNYFVEIKTGNIKIYKKKGDVKEHESIAIHEVLLYLGIDQKRKTPDKCRHGFMIKNSEGMSRYFCSDNECEINNFVATILNIRYPTGIWTPLVASPDSTACAPIEVPESFWGRQSTYIRSSGTSQRLIEQLQNTRLSLKKHVLKKK